MASTYNAEKLVSIAVCTYNGQDYLRTQLDSLVTQSYPNIEIIIVDDCSTDRTTEILDEYQQLYPFLKYIRNTHNLGYVKNFEKAVLSCNGDYIALCDQDDIWETNKIELQMQNIGDHSLIYHDSLFIDHSGKSLQKKTSDMFNLYAGYEPFAFMFFNCISGHTILFSRELIPAIMPFNKDFFHDKWIAFAAAQEKGIKVLQLPLVRYRQHTSSATDLLRIKEEPEQLDRFFSSSALAWIRFCRDKSVHHREYLSAVLNCFDGNTIVKRYKLFFLLLSKMGSVFFTVKKSRISKLNYLRKICFSPKHA